MFNNSKRIEDLETEVATLRGKVRSLENRQLEKYNGEFPVSRSDYMEGVRAMNKSLTEIADAVGLEYYSEPAKKGYRKKTVGSEKVEPIDPNMPTWYDDPPYSGRHIVKDTGDYFSTK